MWDKICNASKDSRGQCEMSVFFWRSMEVINNIVHVHEGVASIISDVITLKLIYKNNIICSDLDNNICDTFKLNMGHEEKSCYIGSCFVLMIS